LINDLQEQGRILQQQQAGILVRPVQMLNLEDKHSR